MKGVAHIQILGEASILDFAGTQGARAIFILTFGLANVLSIRRHVHHEP